MSNNLKSWHNMVSKQVVLNSMDYWDEKEYRTKGHKIENSRFVFHHNYCQLQLFCYNCNYFDKFGKNKNIIVNDSNSNQKDLQIVDYGDKTSKSTLKNDAPPSPADNTELKEEKTLEKTTSGAKVDKQKITEAQTNCNNKKAKT